MRLPPQVVCSQTVVHRRLVAGRVLFVPAGEVSVLGWWTRRVWVISLGMGLVTGAAGAAELTWPGAAPCDTTLQACIDAATTGDIVVIVTNVAIAESPVIANKTLTLRAREGQEAVFASSYLLVDHTAAGDMTVTLERLRFMSGNVSLQHRSVSQSTFIVRGISVLGRSRFDMGAIQVGSFAGSGPLEVTCANNVLKEGQSTSGWSLLEILGEWASSSTVYVTGNRIEMGPTTASIGGIGVTAPRSSVARVYGNRITGQGFDWGIAFSASASGSPSFTAQVEVLNNVVTGQASGFGGNGAIVAGLTAAPATGRIVNNTVTQNTNGIAVQGGVTGSDIKLSNNVVAFNTVGLELPVSGTTNNSNIVYGNGGNTYTPGPGTVTSDPQFRNPVDLRLRDTSPGIDAGNSADLPLFFLWDADGEPRVIGTTVDVGAYEFTPDTAYLHLSTAANSSGNASWLSPPVPATWWDTLCATPRVGRVDVLPPAIDQNLGVFVSGAPDWAIFNQDTGVAMPVGRSFAVYSPLAGRTGVFENVSFTHSATAGNIVGNSTEIDNARTNSQPAAILQVTPNWNPGGSGGTYNDHRTGVWYNAGRWLVFNQDLAAMPNGAAFNVFVAPTGSPNSFTRVVGASSSDVLLDHPLLNENRCAQALVTHNYAPGNVYNDHAFALRYVNGRWWIESVDPGRPTFPVGAAFNVTVNGPASNACRDDLIFADGFQG